MRTPKAGALAWSLVSSSPADFGRALIRDYRIPPHLSRVSLALARLEAGEIRRLMISMPPRHGKSLLASRIFPLWCLARDPGKQIIITSYGQSLPTSHARWVRDRVGYAGELCQGLALADGHAGVDHWATTAGGGMLAAGIGGGITGHGGDLLIVDDPIKDWQTANSIAYKTAAWDWYHATLQTRLSPSGTILAIATRWAVDDLLGRLIDTEGKDWEIISMPAIEREGSADEAALWADRYPLERLREIRDKTRGRIWSSLYQQEPVEHSGEALGDPVRGTPDCKTVLGFVDPAAGGGDSTAAVFGGAMEGGRIGIVAAGLWRKSSIDMVPVIARMAWDAKAQAVVVEDNLDRGYTRSELERCGIPTRPWIATRNKVGRILAAVKTRYRDIVFGPLCAPEYLAEVAGWWELAGRDDAPDALAGLIEALDAGRQITAIDYDDFPFFG